MRRWLVVGIPVGIFFGLLALWGYQAYTTWHEALPETLYATAQKSYKQGEEALKRDDADTTLKALQQADAKLQTLLAADKDPTNPQGLVLRYHTLLQLANLGRRHDGSTVPTISQSRSNEIFAEARRCAERAAADPANVEAQAAMLDVCFRQDQLDLAVRYARNLLDHLPEKPSQPIDFHLYVQGAQYILARAALNPSAPNPAEVIRRARIADDLQKRWVETNFAGAADPPDVRTRWRMILLEAQALMLLAKEGDAGANEEMRSQFTVWLDRIRNDLKNTTVSSGKSQVPLTALTGRDLRSLLDFLSLAVEVAPDRAQALDRLLLNLSVWQALAAAPNPLANPNPRTEVAERYIYWPQLVEKLPLKCRPVAEEWATLSDRLIAAGGQLVAVGVPFDPIVFTSWSRQAQRFGQLELGARFARLGLKAAAALRLPPDDARVVDLRTTVAWLSLLQKKPVDLEEQLTVLRKISGNQTGWTQLIDGLAALDEGLLEKGLADLTLAARFPELAATLNVNLGLGYANAALGRYDSALPFLNALERYYNGRSAKLPEQYVTLANRLSMNRSGLILELFRCHLGVGHIEQALAYREQLRGEPEWLTAGIMLVRHRLGVGPTAVGRVTLMPRTPTPIALAAARQELTELRRTAPRDARTLLLEAELLSIAPPDSASGTARAEEFLREAPSTWQGAADEAQFVLACWLTSHGRADEAGVVLDRLEKLPPGPLSRRIVLLRNQRQLVKAGAFSAADRLLDLLRLAGDSSGMDPYLAGWDIALSRHEDSGLSFLWRGQAEQARGELEAAARSFGRALPFAPFRATARRHLLACLLQLRDKGASAQANAVVTELLQSAAASDPVLLVAFIETALPLDKITGPHGVQKALAALQRVLAGDSADVAAFLAYRAQTWLLAGRPDLAALSIEQSLKANPAHLAALLLAGDTARMNADWAGSLRYAAALEKIRPDRPEVLIGRGDALVHLGDDVAAERAYRELADQHPDRPEGYRGLVELAEKAKDYRTALTLIERWRTRLPGDTAALQAAIRLLCRAGRTMEAGTVGGQALQAAAAREAEVALAVARGFLEGASPESALSWAKKALDAATRAVDQKSLLQARCLLGASCQALAAQTKEPDQRRGYLDQAIDYYRAAFKDAPGNADAGRPLALLLALERGEAEAAFTIAQRVRQGRTTDALRSGDRLSLDLLDSLGIVFRASRHNQETVLLFGEASTRYTREPLVFLHLGRALLALNRTAEGTENLKRAAQFAGEKADRTRDSAEKARWLDIARAARVAEQEVKRP